MALCLHLLVRQIRTLPDWEKSLLNQSQHALTITVRMNSYPQNPLRTLQK